MVPQPNRGHLCLVVGPSAVGKDSLLDGARRFYENEPKVVFPTRTITRPASAGGEHHLPVDDATFQSQKAKGQFLLHWSAHGLCYGIPKSIDQDLKNDCTVVVNVSRTILEEARIRFRNLTILSITAQSEVLAKRLNERGRETEEDIQLRLARADQMKPQGQDVIEIDNSGPLSDGIQRFITAISSAQRETI